jgi:drug/metabolite transporter (DMT)-like permease
MMSDRRHGATSMERQAESAEADADLEASGAAEATPAGAPGAQSSDESKALIISFVLMVVVGLGNKIFQKLQTIPMHNYANSLNLMTCFFYIPASFAYVLPMIKWGTRITPEQRAVPMKDFAVMGLLDSLAGIMQIFASTYLDGTLLILLQQSAIPISMGISKALLSEKYKPLQYLGALVVSGGIAIVLAPRLGDSGDAGGGDSGGNPPSHGGGGGGGSGVSELFGNGDGSGAWLNTSSAVPGCTDADSGDEDTSSQQILIWSLVMIFSCVPMTLSSVYKEKALGETDLDPIYLNGWIALWQFLFSIPIAIPAALVSVPAVEPHMLMTNLFDGLRCYTGRNSITPSYRESNPDFKCFEEDHCSDAPLFVSIYLVFNVGYNILIILILKYGSANILWLAMTIMVPLGSMAFALPFVPEHRPPKLTDVLGLLVILGGLVLYRFGQSLLRQYRSRSSSNSSEPPKAVRSDLAQGLLIQGPGGGAE